MASLVRYCLGRTARSVGPILAGAGDNSVRARHGLVPTGTFTGRLGKVKYGETSIRHLSLLGAIVELHARALDWSSV